jgi:hypothetical protein
VGLSKFAVVPVAGMAMFMAACGSDSSTSPKSSGSPDAASCTVSALSVGQTVQGDLTPAGTGKSCVEDYPWQAPDHDAYQSYSFSAQSGKGYLVTATMPNVFDAHLELVGSTSTGASVLSINDDYVYQLPFVAPATATYAIRLGQDDPYSEAQWNASDTGAFALRAQACKVPLALVTDSVVHTDTLTTTDCTVPRGDFNDEDSSLVQLYTVHFDSVGEQRTLYVTTSTGLYIRSGTVGNDPYCYGYGGCLLEAATDGGSYTMSASDSGTYTLIVGTQGYTAGPTPYTIGFGSEQQAVSHVTPPPMSGSSLASRLIGRNKQLHLKRIR